MSSSKIKIDITEATLCIHESIQKLPISEETKVGLFEKLADFSGAMYKVTKEMGGE